MISTLAAVLQNVIHQKKKSIRLARTELVFPETLAWPKHLSQGSFAQKFYRLSPAFFPSHCLCIYDKESECLCTWNDICFSFNKTH